MKKLLILIIVISSLSHGCKKTSEIEKINNLTILYLKGTPYEIGLAHGQLLRDEINITISKWKNVVEEAYKKSFDSIVNDFFDNTSYVDIAKRTCPDLLDEIYGISEGCGINYETILAFQLSEEISVYADDNSNKHCTSISINRTAGSPTFLAQNMDPPAFLHGYPTLLHINNKTTNVESYIYTFPGFIGLNGINSSGVALTCNSMSMLNYSKHGLPVSFIVRTILNQKHEQLAFDLIKEIPIGIPQCFTIGGISEARCFECSANDIKEFYPFNEKNISLHTNFAIANRDFNEQFKDILAEYGKTVDDPYYCPRYFLAYDKIQEVNYKLNYENIKSILSLNQPEIAPISSDETYGCLIMKLTKDPVLFIAPGKPHENEFIELTFKSFR